MNDEIDELDQFDEIYKIVVIGDSGVGKSNIMIRYTMNLFKEDSLTTVGVGFGHKTVEIDNKIIKTQIWDTAGQDRFKALVRGYYRNAVGGLIVYSVTDRNSFNHLEKWLEELTSNADPGILVMLVGNKSDLESARQVSTQEGKDFAMKHGLNFIETSAKMGTQIEAAFQKVIHEIYRSKPKLKSGGVTSPAPVKPGLKLEPEPEPPVGGTNPPDNEPTQKCRCSIM
jgi:small GTP-binding protein